MVGCHIHFYPEEAYEDDIVGDDGTALNEEDEGISVEESEIIGVDSEKIK